jgi:hypothetical protein
MQIPCVYIPGPAPAVSVANNKFSPFWIWLLQPLSTSLFHSATGYFNLYKQVSSILFLVTSMFINKFYSTYINKFILFHAAAGHFYR